jgi:hypothetical protein
MSTPEALERALTLRTAVARYDELRTRDALAGDPEDDSSVPSERLDQSQALEMLALGEVIARKAGYGRQLAVRSARAAGASWTQIGLALGTSKQSAWEAHNRWIDEQVQQHAEHDYEGFDGAAAARARDLSLGDAEV